jgi:uncharacterized OB-fold protein
MSDTFDHEFDATERYLNGEQDLVRSIRRNQKQSGWKCNRCGRWHPKTHQECWYCRRK